MKLAHGFLLAFAIVLAASQADATPRKPARKESQPTFAAGEPGKASEPNVVVDVTLSYVDGRLTFSPNQLRFGRGESVKFVLRNETQEAHEFVLGTYIEHLAHAQTMRLVANVDHHDSNGRVLPPRSTAVLIWRFSRPGSFEFACLLPHHDHTSEWSKGSILVD